MSHAHHTLLLLPLLATACDSSHPGFSDDEWSLVGTLTPLPTVPADTTNRYADSDSAAALGQKFFFDPRFSGALAEDSPWGQVGQTQKVACASCHQPERDFTDGVTISQGTGFMTRNSQTMVNSAFFQWPLWGGLVDDAWLLFTAVPYIPYIMNGDRCANAHFVLDHYQAEYDAVFVDYPLGMLASIPATCGNPFVADATWDAMPLGDKVAVARIMVNWGKAVQAYQRRLVSRDAPFDRFVAGDDSAISGSAKRGLRLFVGRAACITCHSGPMFSDAKYHNLGVPQVGEHVPAEDDGRSKDVLTAKVVPLDLDQGGLVPYSIFSDDPPVGLARIAAAASVPGELGAFRTPTLRGIALTAPYFHTGFAPTLRDVIEFYDQGGGTEGFVGTKDPVMARLRLTGDEKQDLVEFLNTLTGAPVPQQWTTPPTLPP
jgi:cytochrome c peroxidase